MPTKTESKSTWCKAQLGDVIANSSIQNGLYKPSSAYGGGVPIIRINDFDNHGNFVTKEFQRLEVSEAEQNRFDIQEGDIVINRVNSLTHLGKSAIVPKIKEPTVYESNMMRLRLSNDVLLPIFLAYILQTTQARNYFRSVAKKAVAQASINQDDIKSLTIPIIPLPEQSKIAAILSTWDAAIEKQAALIRAKEQRKRALMQQLLTGKTRFKEFEGQAWKTERFGSVTEYTKGYTYKSTEYSESSTDVYLITLKCIGRGGGFQWGGLKYFGGEVEDNYEVFEGDLLFANTDLTRNAEVVGAPVLVPCLRGKRAMISMDLTKVEVDETKFQKQYLYYLLKTTSIRNFFRARASGSTVLHLDVKATKKLRLELPSLQEQQKIASVLSAADREIHTLQTQLGAYKEQKRGLMQRLLTGKTRVCVPQVASG